MCALVSLSSCEHHEPVNPIKPVDERTVLVLTYNGEVFDQYGDLVSKLPNCLYAAEIISDGEDFFASGTHAMWTTGSTVSASGIITSICLMFLMC